MPCHALTLFAYTEAGRVDGGGHALGRLQMECRRARESDNSDFLKTGEANGQYTDSNKTKQY